MLIIVSSAQQRPINVVDYSFGSKKRNNSNTQQNLPKNSIADYAIGATLLAGSIALGIYLHKTSATKTYQNIEQATKPFKKNLGIEADFTKCKDIESIQALNNVLGKLKQFGCKLPKSVDYCSFNDGSVQKIMSKRGLTPVNITKSAYGYAGKDSRLFINTEAKPINELINAINSRELGHFTTKNPSNLSAKEYVVAHELGHINAKITLLAEGFKSEFGSLSNETVNKILNNIKKYQNEMYDEIKPMTNDFTKSSEVIPDAFAKMIINPKLEFSDRTMLLYDIMGGGAIQNKTIKGKIYSEYMKDLYKRSDKIFA